MHLTRQSVTENHWRARRRRGFTLVEMMVTLAVATILLGLAIPAFHDAALGAKLSAYANSLVGSSILARGEAIKRNAVVTLCVSADGENCNAGSWDQGWIVLIGTTVLLRQEAASSGFKITESGGISSILFQPTGVGAIQATLKICRATPTVGSQEREVKISATGRPSVTKTTTATCPS